MVFLTSENAFSGIICSLFRDRQIFSFKILKIGRQIKILSAKILINREFYRKIARKLEGK